MVCMLRLKTLEKHKLIDQEKVGSHINEPPHDKTYKMACVSSEDSDQPGHPPSLTSLPLCSVASEGPKLSSSRKQRF